MTPPAPASAAPAVGHLAGTPRVRAGGWQAVRQTALATLPHAFAVAVVTAIGLPTLILPFWSDNAIFSVIGTAVAEGRFPYADAWDQKPPSIYFIYAVAVQGPFGLMRNVRVFDLFWTAATVVLLVELGRRWWTLRAGVIGGITYGGMYFTVSTWTQLAQPDSFIGLPLVLALLLVHGARGRGPLLVLAGVSLGFAFQLRAITALLIPFSTLPEVLAAPRGSRIGAWARSMLRLGVGFSALQLGIGLYLLVGGALGEYVVATRFAAGYTRIGGPWQGAHGPTVEDYLQTIRFSFLFWALARLILTVPAVVGGAYGALVLRDRRIQQLVLFVVLAYVGIAVQAKFFWYHFTLMLPFLALLAGWAWDRGLSALRRTQPPVVAAMIGGLIATILLLSTPDVLDSGLGQWRDYLRFQRQPERRETFYERFWGYDASRKVAAHVQQRTQPGETVYVWGYDPLIYLLADRPPASRFIYALPLMSDWAPAAWQEEFIAGMRARPPAYFITQHNQGGPWITGHSVDPADYIAWLPALHEWLRGNYELETTIEDFLVYRRKAPADQ
jgi:hypothetical protein